MDEHESGEALSAHVSLHTVTDNAENDSFTGFFQCDSGCMAKYWALEGYLVLILITTVVGNAVSLYKLWQQSRRNVGNSGHDASLACFVGLNLSVINLCVGLFVITPMVFQLQFATVLFGRTGCQAFAMLFNIYLVGTPLFMVLNAAERFVAIVYPLRLMDIITKKRLRVAASIIWLILAVFATGFMLGSDLHVNSATNSQYCIVKIIGLTAAQSGFPVCLVFVIGPIVVITLLYGATCWTLLKSVAQFRRPASNRKTQTPNDVAMVKSDSNGADKTIIHLAPISEKVDNGKLLSVRNTKTSCGDAEKGCEKSTSAPNDEMKKSTSGGCVNNAETSNRKQAVSRRYRATFLLLLTVVSHTSLCVPFILNQFLSALKGDFYPQTEMEENLTLFSTPILVSSSAVVPILYLLITRCNSQRNHHISRHAANMNSRRTLSTKSPALLHRIDKGQDGSSKVNLPGSSTQNTPA